MSKFAYTLASWFLIGAIIGIIGDISTGHFDISMILGFGFAYVFYPIAGFYLYIDSGSERAIGTLIFGSLTIIYILTPIVVSYVINRNRKKEMMTLFTSKDFGLKYCHECQADVEIRIDEEELSDVIQGKEVKYLGQSAFCNVCGTKIFLEEISRRNEQLARDKM